jgi:hypothetical protein
MPPSQWPRRIDVALEEERHSKLLDQLRVSLDALSGKGLGRGGKQVSPASAHCVCCGTSGHYRRECKQRGKTCNNCGTVGHLASVCRSARKAPEQTPKLKVPGATYASVTAGSFWSCPLCDHAGEPGSKACQRPGCHGKRPAATRVPLPPKPYAPTVKLATPSSQDVGSLVAEELLAKIEAVKKARLVFQDAGLDPSALDKQLKELQGLLPAPPTLLSAVHAEQGRLAGQAKLLLSLETRKEKHAKANAALLARIAGLGPMLVEARTKAEELLKTTLQEAEGHYLKLAEKLTSEQLEADTKYTAAQAAEEAELASLRREDANSDAEPAGRPAHVPSSQAAQASGSLSSGAQPGTPEGARVSSFGNPFSQCDLLDAAGKANFLVFLATQKERMRQAAADQVDDDEFMGPPEQEAKANARDLEDGEVSDPKRSAK